MESKENSTTTDVLNHGVRPEHSILHDAMNKWCEESADGTKRSCIIIHCEANPEGEVSASSHIIGNCKQLVHSVAACMKSITTDNPVGCVLHMAAIRSFIELGMIAPHQTEASKAPEHQTESSDPETHNNTEHE